jgi:CubicO group peptidase (beta-lactamase class C family)
MKKHKRFYGQTTILFVSILLLLLAGCGSDTDTQYGYQPPEQMNDDLDVGTVEDVNIDSALLEQAVDEIESGRFGEVHALLIFKDDKLVFEEYFPGHLYAWDGPNHHGAWVNYDPEREHNIHSVGKSITSASVGIAIEAGFIESVEQSIFEYLPEYQHLNTDGKDEITIEHLLTMTSGLEWEEWDVPYSNAENDVIRLWMECDDQVECILEVPLVSKPGQTFTYSGGNMILLGEIVKNATGRDMEAFANEYLFAPLGIDPVEWVRFDSGVIYAGGDQELTPREMVKFGVTYLNNGVWAGQQMVSADWVEHSATPYPGPDNSWLNNALRPIPPGNGIWGQRGYAYTWYTHDFSEAGEALPAYWADGWGGQEIVVFPEQDAVVVFTGGNYTSAPSAFKILQEYVFPALISG